MAEIKVTYVDLNSLKTYQNNPKDHPQKQVLQITDSIKKFGFNNPILIDENDEIIAGHGRYMAAQQLQMEKRWLEQRAVSVGNIGSGTDLCGRHNNHRV